METKYNINGIDKNLSMGEIAILYYNDILEKDVYNKVIISTILRLNSKKYVSIDNAENNEIIVRIKEGTENLKISEKFILECLKVIDTDNDSIVTLNEFNACENDVFVRYKKNIKQLIIHEAMKDELVDTNKFKEKRRYFFRTLEIFVILILLIIPGLIGIINLLRIHIMILAFIIFAFAKIFTKQNYLVKFIRYSKNNLSKIKNELLNDEIMKYSSKREYINIIMKFVICIIMYFILSYLITKYVGNFRMLEIMITLICLIMENNIYNNTNVYTDKAMIIKEEIDCLKEYLEEYSLIKDRKALEIYLWEDYLSLSVLLGINENVINELNLNLSDRE